MDLPMLMVAVPHCLLEKSLKQVRKKQKNEEERTRKNKEQQEQELPTHISLSLSLSLSRSVLSLSFPIHPFTIQLPPPPSHTLSPLKIAIVLVYVSLLLTQKFVQQNAFLPHHNVHTTTNHMYMTLIRTPTHMHLHTYTYTPTPTHLHLHLHTHIHTFILTTVHHLKGLYRIDFDTKIYFDSIGTEGFYPQVQIHFEVRDSTQHYHVPLLLNPFGYSTYRGS